jgi:hypothetical protein
VDISSYLGRASISVLFCYYVAVSSPEAALDLRDEIEIGTHFQLHKIREKLII